MVLTMKGLESPTGIKCVPENLILFSYQTATKRKVFFFALRCYYQTLRKIKSAYGGLFFFEWLVGMHMHTLVVNSFSSCESSSCICSTSRSRGYQSTSVFCGSKVGIRLCGGKRGAIAECVCACVLNAVFLLWPFVIVVGGGREVVCDGG